MGRYLTLHEDIGRDPQHVTPIPTYYFLFGTIFLIHQIIYFSASTTFKSPHAGLSSCFLREVFLGSSQGYSFLDNNGELPLR